MKKREERRGEEKKREEKRGEEGREEERRAGKVNQGNKHER